MCKLTELAVKNIDSPTYLRFNDIEDSDSNSGDIEWCENQIVNEGSETIVISYGLCSISSRKFLWKIIQILDLQIVFL